MNLEQAKAHLASAFQRDGSLEEPTWYLSYTAGTDMATLDGQFSSDDLEAISLVMRDGAPDDSSREPALVTDDNLDQMIERYAGARGGELNENTHSEARFVAIAQYRGAYILSTGLGPVWIGVQNASSRWTEDGHAFACVRDAILAIWSNRHPTAMRAAVYYFDDSSRMLRWIADRIDEYKSSGDFLLYT